MRGNQYEVRFNGKMRNSLEWIVWHIVFQWMPSNMALTEFYKTDGQPQYVSECQGRDCYLIYNGKQMTVRF